MLQEFFSWWASKWNHRHIFIAFKSKSNLHCLSFQRNDDYLKTIGWTAKETCQKLISRVQSENKAKQNPFPSEKKNSGVGQGVLVCVCSGGEIMEIQIVNFSLLCQNSIQQYSTHKCLVTVLLNLNACFSANDYRKINYILNNCLNAVNQTYGIHLQTWCKKDPRTWVSPELHRAQPVP